MARNKRKSPGRVAGKQNRLRRNKLGGRQPGRAGGGTRRARGITAPRPVNRRKRNAIGSIGARRQRGKSKRR